MKYLKYTAIAAGLLSITSLSAQKSKGTSAKKEKKVTFETDATTGVKYHFFKRNKTGNRPKLDDVARVVFTLRTDKDSVFFSSHDRGGDSLGAFWVPINKSHIACIEQGIMLMTAGDSAAFVVNADSAFNKTFRAARPPFVMAGSNVTFNVKLISFESKQQYMTEKQKEMEKQQQAGKAEEIGKINGYLTSNKLSTTPDTSGVYYIEHNATTGTPVHEGDSVEMKYTGMFLDGKIFDASANHGGTGTFSFQYSKHASLIQGWIRVVGAMHEGEKVKVLIPSDLGYGARGAGGLIPPNCPLIFEMELVKVTSHK